jgi:poly-gamma-glutamate capsule biosynthesis protein CapA/YwtB (metallophosphatase superfamily)
MRESSSNGSSEMRQRLAWRIVPAVLAILAGLVVWIGRPFIFGPSGDDLGAPGGTACATVGARGASASVLLAGDTHFGESYFTGDARSPPGEHGYGYTLLRLRALTSSADYVIVNLETPLTGLRWSPLSAVKKYVHWGNPQQGANALAEIGVRAAGLANNHSFDFLRQGLDDTMAALQSRQIAAFGAGHTVGEALKPHRFDIRFPGRSLHVAVIGALEGNLDDLLCGAYATRTGAGAYALSRQSITRQIQALKHADPELFVIAFPHWGSNSAWRSEAQSRLGRAMIDAGADLVVGHGAHLSQEIEAYGGRLIVYNLGNFAFLAPGRYAELGDHSFSMAARIDFTEGQSELGRALRLYFILSNNLLTGYQPRLLAGDELERAEEMVMSRKTIDAVARARLSGATTRGRDETGEYLRIDLGALSR